MQTIWSTRKILPIGVHLFSSASRVTKGTLAKSASASKQVKATNRRTLVAVVICVVATIASLAPFANKAFHIDDTVFLCAARQICVHPADPFGCKLNWYGTSQELSEVVNNPPLASYYAALVASCFGWSETALHLAFLVPAVAAVLGTYFLAVRFCAEPLLAALATLLCPVFLISSTTLMCDIMMLAFMVWAVVLWLRSADGGSHVPAILSACLVAAASVTKYFAVISLVPLLLAYSLLRWPRVGWRVLYLAIPIAAFLGYDWAIRSLYGHSPLCWVGSYALTNRKGSSCPFRGVVTLSFIGGCLATVIFYAPMLWSRRVLVAGILGVGLMVGLLFTARSLGDYELPGDNTARLLVILEFSIFVVAGVGLLALAVADLWHARDAESTLLVLWTVGTFVFVWLINWTVNGRTILPMVPAATILIVRRIDRYTTGSVGRLFSWKFLPLPFVGVLAVAVAWADKCWADTARVAAGKIHDQYSLQKDTVLFEGHWGFQYYMESYGFKAVDYACRLVPGTIVIMPAFNEIIVSPFPKEAFSKIVSFELVSCPYLATMRLEVSAGFYSGNGGILPFAVAPVSNECYYVKTVARVCEMIGQYQRELKQQPDSAELLVTLCNVLIDANRAPEAKEYLERAVQRNSNNPGYAAVYYKLGVASANRGQFDEAIAAFREALEIKPDYVEARNNLGAALQSQGRIDEAMVQYRTALEIKPDYARVYYNLGTVLAGRGRFDEALAQFQRALELKPDDADAQNNLAWLLATCPVNSVRNGATAIEHAQRANQLCGGRRPDILNTLAAAYAEAGRFPEALATAHTALELATQQNTRALADALRAWIRLYEAGKPYRQTPSASTPSAPLPPKP